MCLCYNESQTGTTKKFAFKKWTSSKVRQQHLIYLSNPQSVHTPSLSNACDTIILQWYRSRRVGFHFVYSWWFHHCYFTCYFRSGYLFYVIKANRSRSVFYFVDTISGVRATSEPKQSKDFTYSHSYNTPKSNTDISSQPSIFQLPVKEYLRPTYGDFQDLYLEYLE